MWSWGGGSGSSNLNKHWTSFHERKGNKVMWKSSERARCMVTSPAYKAVLHTLLQSITQSSPHHCQLRKILLLCWLTLGILLWLVKFFLTFLLGVCKEVRLTITCWRQRHITSIQPCWGKQPNLPPSLTPPRELCLAAQWQEENANMTAQERVSECKYEREEGKAQLPTS